jgi:hypothetical protein
MSRHAKSKLLTSSDLRVRAKQSLERCLGAEAD